MVQDKWIKAAVLGTYWASSEIVLGSYLHNLRVPFSGNILTAIGLIILISVSFLWKEKGLFWRAGVITGLAKAISPSAVIFGPMIAIMAEAFLFEAATRLFGRTASGYLLGAMLAMSWNLFHKIVNFIIYYGYDIVALYTDMVRYAAKQLHIRVGTMWWPVLVLLFVQLVLGAVTAVVGMRIGERLLTQSTRSQSAARTTAMVPPAPTKAIDFHHSLLWLAADAIFIVGCIYLINLSHWLVWAPAVTVLVVIWALRYKRALRQLAKAKFWISFAVITLLTALLFNKNGLAEGLLVGMRMNFRATVIILGFSVLGTELYHPRIRAFLQNSAFRQLSLALELSLASLPAVVAAVPDIKAIVKSPVTILYQLLAGVEDRLREVRAEAAPRIFFITGAVGQGKTTCVQTIVSALQQQGVAVAGLYSPRLLQEGKTVGYDVVDIQNGRRSRFLHIQGDPGMERIGRFYIYPQGLAVGIKALAAVKAEVVVIDQVGPLEMDGGGWLEPLQRWLRLPHIKLVLTARPDLVDDMMQAWNVNRASINAVSQKEVHAMAGRIVAQIRGQDHSML